MKKIVSLLCILVMAGTTLLAQTKDNKGNQWRQKVRAEKVAFLTAEVDLSVDEAQAFWPAYNAYQKELREAHKALGEAFNTLRQKLEAGDEAEIGTALDRYLAAKDAVNRQEAAIGTRFQGILPAVKIARLCLAEEKFRIQQIDRLGKPGGQEKKTR